MDWRTLSIAELGRRLNGGRRGPVITERRLREHQTRAGSRIGTARQVDFFRFLAWLWAEVREKPKPLEGTQRLLFENLDPEDVPAPAGVDPKDYWDVRWRKARALEKETENQVRRAKLIDREEIARLLTDRAQALRSGLARLENEIPPIVVLLDNPRDIKAVLRQKHRELLADYTRPLER